MNYVKDITWFSDWLALKNKNITISSDKDYFTLMLALNTKNVWRTYFIRPKLFSIVYFGESGHVSFSGIMNVNDAFEIKTRTYEDTWQYNQYKKIVCGIRLQWKNISGELTYEILLSEWMAHCKKVFRKKSLWKVTPVRIINKVNPRVRIAIPKSLREEVFKRDGNKCRYCNSENSKFHIDHIIPVCQGGDTSLENLVLACSSCNVRKSGRTPRQAKMELLPIGV